LRRGGFRPAINDYESGSADMIKQTKWIRIMALIVALSMVAGVLIGLLVQWLFILPILLIVGVAGFLLYRRYWKRRG
jgi:hypothetical protein